MINSISTIFTMDLYKPACRSAPAERMLVFVGRLVAFIAMVAAMITAKPLLGSFDQAFQYIQEFTGFFTPGIVVIFLLGMFWSGPRPPARCSPPSVRLASPSCSRSIFRTCLS